MMESKRRKKEKVKLGDYNREGKGGKWNKAGEKQGNMQSKERLGLKRSKQLKEKMIEGGIKKREG